MATLQTLLLGMAVLCFTPNKGGAVGQAEVTAGSRQGQVGNQHNSEEGSPSVERPLV